MDPKSVRIGAMWDQEQFQSLVANVPGAVYRCALSSDWEMEFMSDEVEQICGYRASDFVGMPPARTFAIPQRLLTTTPPDSSTRAAPRTLSTCSMSRTGPTR